MDKKVKVKNKAEAMLVFLERMKKIAFNSKLSNNKGKILKEELSKLVERLIKFASDNLCAERNKEVLEQFKRKRLEEIFCL